MIQFSGIPDAEAFNLIKQTRNPTPSKGTNAIWIFSARHDINQAHLNCATRPVNFQSLASVQGLDKCDKEDDYLRIKAGLELGAKLTAERAGKNLENLSSEDYELYAPIIIYNGSPEQNIAFSNAVHEKFNKLFLPNYYASKIVILPLPKDKIYTGGQFDSLTEQIKSDPRLHGLDENTADILCISSAYHLRRIQRLFNSKTFSCPFSPSAKVTLWGIDRNFQRPCALEDIEGELKRIKMYYQGGDIGKSRPADWYSLSSLKHWTPLRHMQKSDGIEINKKSYTPVPVARRYSFS